MEIVFSILMGLGLSAACGFRVFIPLLVAGIGVNAGTLHPAPDFTWLGSTPALVGFGTATLLEIAAFYIPWLDNALDVAATPAAVIAGTVVLGSFIVDMNPWVRWSLSLIAGGGLAAVVQTGTIGLRGLSLTGTGGLANPIVSTLEWFAATLTSVLAILAPVLLLTAGLISACMLWLVWRRRQARSSAQEL